MGHWSTQGSAGLEKRKIFGEPWTRRRGAAARGSHGLDPFRLMKYPLKRVVSNFPFHIWDNMGCHPSHWLFSNIYVIFPKVYSIYIYTHQWIRVQVIREKLDSSFRKSRFFGDRWCVYRIRIPGKTMKGSIQLAHPLFLGIIVTCTHTRLQDCEPNINKKGQGYCKKTDTCSFGNRIIMIISSLTVSGHRRITYVP